MYASFCKLPYIYFFFCYKTEWDDDNAFLRPPPRGGLAREIYDVFISQQPIERDQTRRMAWFQDFNTGKSLKLQYASASFSSRPLPFLTLCLLFLPLDLHCRALFRCVSSWGQILPMPRISDLQSPMIPMGTLQYCRYIILL